MGPWLRIARPDVALDVTSRALGARTAVRDELSKLLDVHRRAAPEPAPRRRSCHPRFRLTLHARYSRQEVIAALGFGDGVKPKVTQGGILWVPQADSDVFFVDLHKAERDYSPTTMYRDYAINRELFHWESQSRQTPQQPTVQRYINHRTEGTRCCSLCASVRPSSSARNRSRFSGPSTYVDHRGERPVAFTWRLPHRCPRSSSRSPAASQLPSGRDRSGGSRCASRGFALSRRGTSRQADSSSHPMREPLCT